MYFHKHLLKTNTIFIFKMTILLEDPYHGAHLFTVRNPSTDSNPSSSFKTLSANK